jgi:hypothetical protein
MEQFRKLEISNLSKLLIFLIFISADVFGITHECALILEQMAAAEKAPHSMSAVAAQLRPLLLNSGQSHQVAVVMYDTNARKYYVTMGKLKGMADNSDSVFNSVTVDFAEGDRSSAQRVADELNAQSNGKYGFAGIYPGQVSFHGGSSGMKFLGAVPMPEGASAPAAAAAAHSHSRPTSNALDQLLNRADASREEHPSTLAIRNQTSVAGIPVAQLEAVMKPGKSSHAGFLGSAETLLDVLAHDNETVVANGVTHAQLASPLESIMELAPNGAAEVELGGTKYKVIVDSFRGMQASPFNDGQLTNVDVHVTNLSNGKSLSYSGLIPHFIKQYGFYEGKGTSYRLPPEKILEVFPWVKNEGVHAAVAKANQPVATNAPSVASTSSAFKPGERNSTDAILSLTHLNERAIADIEREMRPGKGSQAGFLGADESLVEVLAADNEAVAKLGLTHGDIAQKISGVIDLVRANRVTFNSRSFPPVSEPFVYDGRRYRIEVQQSKGLQFSPFGDGAGSADYRLTDLETGKSIFFSDLHPDMIAKYGFYEGKGTTYRLNPEDAAAVFGLAKAPVSSHSTAIPLTPVVAAAQVNPVDSLHAQHPIIAKWSAVSGLPWETGSTTKTMSFGKSSSWKLGIEKDGNMTAEFIIDPRDKPDSISQLIIQSARSTVGGDFKTSESGRKKILRLKFHDKDLRPETTDTSPEGRRIFLERLVAGLPKTAVSSAAVPESQSTLAIRSQQTINNIPISELEKTMRPGRSSQAGFLGQTEHLLDVLAKDNETVLGNGLTHQQMAAPLSAIMNLVPYGTKVVEYAGQKYEVKVTSYRGWQDSPFRDEATASTDIYVKNLSNGRSIDFSGLLPHMIKNYGFYEGEETPYRLDPEEILEVFPQLKPAR